MFFFALFYRYRLPVNVMWPYIMNAGESSKFRELMFFFCSLFNFYIFLSINYRFFCSWFYHSILILRALKGNIFFVCSVVWCVCFSFLFRLSACRRFILYVLFVVGSNAVHIPHFIATVISNRFANYISFNCLRLCILKHCVQHICVSVSGRSDMQNGLNGKLNYWPNLWWN